MGPRAGLNAVANRKNPYLYRKSNLGRVTKPVSNVCRILKECLTASDTTELYE